MGETDTSLYISSWGTKGPPTSFATKNENPKQKIQSYLKEPTAVEVRDNIDGTCLVSGLVNSKERSDQFAFDLLNNEESSFEFSKIVAFCDDAKFAKKRLLSRSARYTGLLDKLDFVQAESAGAIPTVAQLDGVTSWVAVVESTPENDVFSICEDIAKVAKDSPVKNVAVLLTNALNLDAKKCESVVEKMQDEKISYSIAAVGKIGEHGEGKIPYKMAEFGSDDGVLDDAAGFSREESLRMITDMLQLKAGANKALSISEVKDANATEAKLVIGLREAGYVRVQEIDHMIRDGAEEYQKVIDEWDEKNPTVDGETEEAWWETEEFKKQLEEARRSQRRDTDDDEEEEIDIEAEKDPRTEEIEEIAKEWAKREYFRQSMSRIESTSDDIQTEEEFIESVWETALVEGEKKYVEIYESDVEDVDDFVARQKQKKRMMLKRAKEDLADILDEEDLLEGDEDDDLKDILRPEN